MAAKIETADLTTWTISLRRGWTFHDGSPVTADSFIDAWNYAADGANGMRQQQAFANIVGFTDISGPEPSPQGLAGLTKVDDWNFNVTLNSPDSQWETRLATAAFSPLPENVLTGGDGNLIGNGAFTVEDISDDRLLLARFDEYRGRKPLLTRVEFTREDDSSTLVDAVADGDFDATTVTGLSEGSEPAGVTVATSPGTTLEYLLFPLWDPRFADPKTREAFSVAIDRAQILAVNPELDRSAANSWTVPQANGYSAGGCRSACTYNVERARTSLAAGGGFAGPLVISYPESSSASLWIDAVCTSITNTLEVECQGRPMAAQEFTTAVASRQITGPFFSSWSLPPVPDVATSIGPLYLTNAPLNGGDYSNPEFDELFTVALATATREATRAFTQSQYALAASLPSIPLWYPHTSLVTGERVKDAALTPFGFIDLYRTTVS
jgi:oligopeptide transport system substrate-binding protein